MVTGTIQYLILAAGAVFCGGGTPSPAESRAITPSKSPAVIPQMRDFLLACRKNGLKTYLLADTPENTGADPAAPDLPGLSVAAACGAGQEIPSPGLLDLFDDTVLSAEAGLSDPASDIYAYTLKKFRLTPEACLFFSNEKPDLWAARAAGMQTALFEVPGEKTLQIVSRDEKFSDAFVFPYPEDAAWYDYDGMAAVTGRGTALIIDANGDVFADYMDPAGHMVSCTIGENEDTWEADNFPVEEGGYYTYGERQL